MFIRKTSPQDLPAVERLYGEARAALKAAGVDQWQDGYPNGDTARKDMEQGVSYVMEDDGGQIVATACLAFGREPTYERMLEGSWAADPAEYGFLHRIAVAPSFKGQGAAGLLFDELKRQAKEKGLTVIRGDTHRDNRSMQRVMEKSGLLCRGVILLEDGTERLAYEAILQE